MTSVPLQLTVTPSCGGAPISLSDTWTGTLQPGASVNHTISTPPGYVLGAQEICVSTGLSGDGYSFNDAYCKYATGFTDQTIPFSTDFESCARDEHGFAIMGNSGGTTYKLWEKKNGGGAHSGTRSWKTNGAGKNYRDDTREALRIPRFIGFDTISGAEIRFLAQV